MHCVCLLLWLHAFFVHEEISSTKLAKTTNNYYIKVGVSTNPVSRFQGFSPFDKNPIGGSDPCPYHYCGGRGQA